jgi:hypothetical protein
MTKSVEVEMWVLVDDEITPWARTRLISMIEVPLRDEKAAARAGSFPLIVDVPIRASQNMNPRGAAASDGPYRGIVVTR